MCVMCVMRICASLSENADFFTRTYMGVLSESRAENWTAENLSRSVKNPTVRQGASRPETDPEAMPRKSALHSVKAVSMPARQTTRPPATSGAETMPASQTAHGTRQDRPHKRRPEQAATRHKSEQRSSLASDPKAEQPCQHGNALPTIDTATETA